MKTFKDLKQNDNIYIMHYVNGICDTIYEEKCYNIPTISNNNTLAIVLNESTLLINENYFNKSSIFSLDGNTIYSDYDLFYKEYMESRIKMKEDINFIKNHLNKTFIQLSEMEEYNNDSLI